MPRNLWDEQNWQNPQKYKSDKNLRNSCKNEMSFQIDEIKNVFTYRNWGQNCLQPCSNSAHHHISSRLHWKKIRRLANAFWEANLDGYGGASSYWQLWLLIGMDLYWIALLAPLLTRGRFGYQKIQNSNKVPEVSKIRTLFLHW